MAKQPRLRYGMPERWAVEWGEDQHGMFMGFGVGEVVQRLRYIPPGRFLMGSPVGEAGRYEDEGPQHEVELTRGYWLADTPCTQALWEAVMGTSPSHFRGMDRPVEQVSWHDCQEFVNRLNERVHDLHARLPTEAEWEYACRAGAVGATWRGELHVQVDDCSAILEPIAWYWGNSGANSSYWKNSGGDTKPVRGKAANPWGLYDMLGNVWEWCHDIYGSYESSAKKDPTGTVVGPYRSFRGGSWSDPPRCLRAAVRDSRPPDYRDSGQGFRLAHCPRPN